MFKCRIIENNSKQKYIKLLKPIFVTILYELRLTANQKNVYELFYKRIYPNCIGLPTCLF